jgi:hypothetical protein
MSLRRSVKRFGYGVTSLRGMSLRRSAKRVAMSGTGKVQKMSGSLTGAPKPVSRKSKSQPWSACRMWRLNIQP